MTMFRDFLQWYNNLDVVPTLDAMQKKILKTIMTKGYTC